MGSRDGEGPKHFSEDATGVTRDATGLRMGVANLAGLDGEAGQTQHGQFQFYSSFITSSLCGFGLDFRHKDHSHVTYSYMKILDL